MDRILYDYFRSSAAYRVRIALNIKNLDVKQHSINLKPGDDVQHSEEYQKINPQGRVPYFVDGDFELGQSPAILEYLEESYPTPPLLPESIKDKAYIRQLSAIIGCDIHPLNNLSVLKYLKAEFNADQPAISQWYSSWIIAGFSAFEALLVSRKSNGLFCFGDSVTLADLYLIPQVYNARRFNVDLSQFPTIASIETHCLTLSAFSKAIPEAQDDA
jgi:maleylacetoacetate isomerase